MAVNNMLTLGIDIGSTTAKLTATRDGVIVYSKYERHMSKFAFHQCTYVLDSYIRNGSKYMADADI